MKEIYTKIAYVQREIGIMKKDTKGYNYKYFDINQLLEKLQPLLREAKLVLCQPIVDSKLQTVVFDLESGQELKTDIALPTDVKPQDLGSAITYFRRYSIVALFALQAIDDDASATMPKTGAKSSNKGSFAPNSGKNFKYQTVAEEKVEQAKNKADKDNNVEPF